MGIFGGKRKRNACSEKGCTTVAWARGLCSRHYQRQYRNSGPTCEQDGCDGHQVARGLCTRHYQAAYRARGAHCAKRGCVAPSFARKMCVKHYHRWYNEQLREKGVAKLSDAKAR